MLAPGQGDSFFSFLSLFPLVQASSLLTGEARCAAGRAPAEVGLSPRCPPGAGIELGPFQSPHLGLPGLSRQIPPGGVRRPAHTSPLSSFPTGSKMGKPRQMGLAWKTRGLLTFAHRSLYM